MNDTPEAATLSAIRTARTNGRAHVWTGEQIGPWFSAACGRGLSSPEVIPWSATAPEDRCRRCAAMHPVAAEDSADRLHHLWTLAREAADATPSVIAYGREQDTYDALVDHVVTHHLVGSRWDPLGPILPCGCRQLIVADEGHEPDCPLGAGTGHPVRHGRSQRVTPPSAPHVGTP